ncbi:glycosyltransferase family 21 protein [Suillus clintonianus]|uniref:glycosyltransferase family 21 protein n=1 Tax=Suillus clintonianus TaxID=1904413 RepID=UPI001B879119|nr:glycosyltransferase family 21 protein [Suillus clintonianus]KAG2138535.1 glycosyltransferase family 21 protein [Suillus clintonianus]
MNSHPESKQCPSLFPFICAIIGLVWYVVIWEFVIRGCRTARIRYRTQPRSSLATAPPSSFPGVSILRPLKGLDANLYENLESTFTQQYPNYEIILSVADEQDQALPVARALISKYPNVTARVIIGEEVVGVNPKINNLIRSYHEATHDILWVIDSGVSVAPGTLARSVALLETSTPTIFSKKRIALIHHVPFASTQEQFLGSLIEEAFLNTNYAKMYLAINVTAVEACVVGKSNLYRRSDLERLNGSLKPRALTDNDQPEDCLRGLAAFGKFLAEDYAISSALWHELDLRHDLSCDVAHYTIGKMSFSDYVWKRVRWIRVRKHMVLIADVAEPFTESLVAGSIAAAALWYLFGIRVWLFLVIHNAAWLWVDLDVYESLAGRPLAADRRWLFIGAWCLRELLALPIWILAMLGDEVVWRGKRYEMFGAGEVRSSRQEMEFRGGDKLLGKGTTINSC